MDLQNHRGFVKGTECAPGPVTEEIAMRSGQSLTFVSPRIHVGRAQGNASHYTRLHDCENQVQSA